MDTIKGWSEETAAHIEGSLVLPVSRCVAKFHQPVPATNRFLLSAEKKVAPYKPPFGITKSSCQVLSSHRIVPLISVATASSFPFGEHASDPIRLPASGGIL